MRILTAENIWYKETRYLGDLSWFWNLELTCQHVSHGYSFFLDWKLVGQLGLTFVLEISSHDDRGILMIRAWLCNLLQITLILYPGIDLTVLYGWYLYHSTSEVARCLWICNNSDVTYMP